MTDCVTALNPRTIGLHVVNAGRQALHIIHAGLGSLSTPGDDGSGADHHRCTRNRGTLAVRNGTRNAGRGPGFRGSAVRKAHVNVPINTTRSICCQLPINRAPPQCPPII